MRSMSPYGAGAGDGRRIGVLLAISDFPALGAGYRVVLGAEPDLEIAGEATERATMADAVAASTADVVVAECQPEAGGGCTTFRGLEAIRAARPEARILVIECRCGAEQFGLAIRAGADGFLTREAEPTDVVDAVRCVARGERYVSPTIVTRMVNTYVRRSGDGTDDAYESLSERSREVLRLAAFGHTNREIARALNLSEQTVHNQRATIMERLGLHDRVDLLKFALRRGVIQVAEL
jgi:DNA-binding NarL/FixJ family response regulator